MVQPESAWRRLLRLVRTAEDDIDAELQFHLSERVDDLVASGAGRAEAMRTAQAELGDLDAIRRQLVSVRHSTAVNAHAAKKARGAATLAAADFRAAFRGLKAQPAIVAGASVSLALAIAVNATTFAAVDRIALHPFAVPFGDQLVRVSLASPRNPDASVPVPMDLFRAARLEARTVDVGGYVEAGHNLSAGGHVQRVRGAHISAGFFALQGVPMLAGREFRPEEESGSLVAVIGEGLWRRAFDGAPDVVGRAVVLNGTPYVVVGVIPRKYSLPFLDGGELWTPLFVEDEGRIKPVERVSLLARLRPRETVRSAQAEFAVIMARRAVAAQDRLEPLEPRTESVLDLHVSPGARRASVAFLTAVLLVLLIACANVANMLLAKSSGRAKDAAIQAAIGASGARIARQRFVESGLIAAVACLLGLALSVGGIAWLRAAFGPNLLGDLPPFTLSPRVIAYSLAVSAGAVFLFGTGPSLRGLKPDLSLALRADSPTSGCAPVQSRLRTLLIGFEMSLAVVLLVFAGLSIRARQNVGKLDLGLQGRTGLVFATVVSAPAQGPNRQLEVLDGLQAALREIPGVGAVGFGSDLPFDGSASVRYGVGLQDSVRRGVDHPAQVHAASPGFLEALGIRLVAGRLLASGDRQNAQLVAVVNEALVRRHWAQPLDALGRRISLSGREVEIVGVVSSVREWGVQNLPPAAVYLPAAQAPLSQASFAIAAERNPADLLAEVRDAIAGVAPAQPIFRVGPLQDYQGRGYRDSQILMATFGLVAVVALVLGVGGVSSVVAYTTSQQAREFAVRRALGATAGQIVALVLRRSGAPVLVGSAIGILLALAASQTLASLFFGASPLDPLVYGAVALVLGLAATVAMLVPAFRAIRLDPSSAIRGAL
ncbi:MAG: ABC transporter permease [Gemmatimonadales bacterium]|nr:ABC transporter permease [Gemmatimonadales bacterium]